MSEYIVVLFFSLSIYLSDFLYSRILAIKIPNATIIPIIMPKIKITVKSGADFRAKIGEPEFYAYKKNINTSDKSFLLTVIKVGHNNTIVKKILYYD